MSILLFKVHIQFIDTDIITSKKVTVIEVVTSLINNITHIRALKTATRINGLLFNAGHMENVEHQSVIRNINSNEYTAIKPGYTWCPDDKKGKANITLNDHL
jgi:hypothetical protein